MSFGILQVNGGLQTYENVDLDNLKLPEGTETFENKSAFEDRLEEIQE